MLPEPTDDPAEDPRRDHESDGELPFGMSGVTIIIERLRQGIEAEDRDGDDAWTPHKCRVVAQYILSLRREYWLTGKELAFCRRVLGAN